METLEAVHWVIKLELDLPSPALEVSRDRVKRHRRHFEVKSQAHHPAVMRTTSHRQPLKLQLASEHGQWAAGTASKRSWLAVVRESRQLIISSEQHRDVRWRKTILGLQMRGLPMRNTLLATTGESPVLVTSSERQSRIRGALLVQKTKWPTRPRKKPGQRRAMASQAAWIGWDWMTTAAAHAQARQLLLVVHPRLRDLKHR